MDSGGHGRRIRGAGCVSPHHEPVGCTLPALIVPLFLVAGGALGWTVGRPFGVAVGVLGGLVGAALGVPASALLGAAVAGALWLVKRALREWKS